MATASPDAFFGDEGSCDACPALRLGLMGPKEGGVICDGEGERSAGMSGAVKMHCVALNSVCRIQLRRREVQGECTNESSIDAKGRYPTCN